MAHRSNFESFARVALFAVALAAHADTPPAPPLAYRGANPRHLSGGLYTALDSVGAFGGRVTPRAARDGTTDLSKGKPPAVLDARVGMNVRLGADPTALTTGLTSQAEPHIARSVANPNLLLATFQEGRFTNGGALDCGYALSRDGGLTWTRALIPQLTQISGGVYRRATDPVAAIGPQGDLYLATLGALDDGFATAAVVVSGSTDGGTTWSSPTPVFQQISPLSSPDKEWLAVNDFAGTPNPGRLVCTWSNFQSDASGRQTGVNILLSISDDRAATWSAPIAVTPANSANQGSFPVFLPDGSLVVIYATFISSANLNRFNLQCKRSLDGGRTFPATATTIVAAIDGWEDPDLRNGLEIPSATVARQSGTLFVTYTAVVDGTPRVMVTRSTNQGATWSAPVAASDNPTGISVMNPAVATTPDGSAVSVVFMDKRLSPVAADGHRYFIDHYTAQSFDSGATWQPNLRLSEMSSDVRYAPLTSSGYMLGDYLGVAPSFASTLPCVAIWCDTRSGDADPFAVRFVPAATASFEAWRIARFTQTELIVSPTQLLVDFDHDGASNFYEFATGTNPRVAESGETLVLTKVSSSAINAAIAGRAESVTELDLIRPPPSVDPGNFGPEPPRPPFSVVRNLAPAPTARPRDGLVWCTFQVTTPVDQLSGLIPQVTRTLPDTVPSSFSGGSGEFVTVATNSRLTNLSTRGQLGTGANQMIVGFVIDGPKTMLVRAAGPALTSFGVSGVLADPRISLVSGDPAAIGVVTNDNWQQGNATAPLFARVGAFPFATGSLDAALVQSLPAQSYTALVAGAGNATGVALVEAYDADSTPGAPTGPRLVNLSTRANVGSGDGVLIAGFVVGGTQPRRMLIRAVGPSLAQFGLGGLLADPQLTLFRGSQQLSTNDDWEISRSSAAIAATAQRVGAFALNAASLDAALLITLQPGNYTVVVSGVGGATGLALVEIYDAD